MTSLQIQTSIRGLAARCARVVHELFALENRGRGECRVPDAPAASCAMVEVAHEGRHHRSTGNTRHSRTRMVLTAYFVLSPATNSSCHRRQRIKGLSAPGRADLPPHT